jgi:hypothetical protein
VEGNYFLRSSDAESGEDAIKIAKNISPGDSTETIKFNPVAGHDQADISELKI